MGITCKQERINQQRGDMESGWGVRDQLAKYLQGNNIISTKNHPFKPYLHHIQFKNFTKFTATPE